MKHIQRHILYMGMILLLLGITGCRKQYPVVEKLLQAETMMNEHPDSTLNLLKGIAQTELQTQAHHARYALLYTQAQDKTYRDETNDSLISVAVDYYRHTDDVRRKFLSYYYKGRIYTNAKDYLSATSCYMEAEQLADEVGDGCLVGLLYAELGRIYRLYYDYPKSLEAQQKAAECYEKAGKIRHRNYMWLNQSDVCRNMEQYDESERLLRMALESAQQEDDKALIKKCLGSLVMQNVEIGQISVAKVFYSELLSFVGENDGSAYFMGQMAKIYVSEKDYYRAKQNRQLYRRYCVDFIG